MANYKVGPEQVCDLRDCTYGRDEREEQSCLSDTTAGRIHKPNCHCSVLCTIDTSSTPNNQDCPFRIGPDMRHSRTRVSQTVSQSRSISAHQEDSLLFHDFEGIGPCHCSASSIIEYRSQVCPMSFAPNPVRYAALRCPYAIDALMLSCLIDSFPVGECSMSNMKGTITPVNGRRSARSGTPCVVVNAGFAHIAHQSLARV